MSRFAIIGHPVSHALSPRLHTAAFRALGLTHTYEAVDVAPEELPAAIGKLREEGFAGFNVTVPHKEAVLPLLDEVDATARAIGAVNTVRSEGNRFLGTNTDALGFAKLLEPFAGAISEKPVMVLGAGGAARAVLHVLTTVFAPARIVLLNRTVDRAERLAAEFSTKSILIKPDQLFQEDLQKAVEEASVLINTTSVGMKPYVDATPLDDVDFRKGQVVVDLIYTPPETVLLKRAARSGATAVNGSEMLLQQAAAAFRSWTGREMPLGDVRKVLME
jgi:shikimate dehydrogenase